jgi:hypothetical protein
MSLLKPKERKAIIERAALRYHEDGIERLKTTGKFEKYLPMFHYDIREPSPDNHIFITELFGNEKFKNSRAVGHHRLQYHGNYKGLDRVQLTMIGENMIIPYPEDVNRKKISSVSKSMKEILEDDLQKHRAANMSYNPSVQVIAQGRHIPKELKENFDNALIYLDYMLGFILPDSFRTNIGSEQFSKTYYFP